MSQIVSVVVFATMGCGARSELSLSSTSASDDGESTNASVVCGNGSVEAPEQCEDGNALSGDGCSEACLWESVAIACGGGYNCALGANGVVKCWGGGEGLGTGSTENLGDQVNELGSRLPAVDLGTGARARSISGGTNACAVLADGPVKCWGSNAFGGLGLGDTDDRGDESGEMGDRLPPVDFGAGLRVQSLTGGYYENCAVLTGGGLKCWGRNSVGGLGVGDRENRGERPDQMGNALPFVDLGTGRTARLASVGGEFACALLDDASVKCWGQNNFGQLGQGDRHVRGDEPSEMGDALRPVDLGAATSVRSIAASSSHVCVLLNDSRVKCWGYNSQGQLGTADGSNHGDLPATMGDALVPVNLGSGRIAVELAAGAHFTCARFDDGAVKCWGYNDQGQLGLGDTLSRGIYANELGDNLPTVDLGTGRHARSICARHTSSCALLDNGQVKCWGSNSQGQLGLGNTGMGPLGSRGAEPNQMGDDLPPVDLRF